MKTSAVLASLLFGSLAVAAPVDKRALVYKTEVVTETVIVYTTVYDDEPASSTAEGLFYEQPGQTTSSVATPSSSAAAPAYTPPAYTPPAQASSSVYTPPPAASTPPAAPAPQQQTQSTTTQQPAAAPAPAATSAAAAPAAPAPAAPAPSPSQPSSNNAASTGDEYTNVDITIYDNDGGYGACGTALYDTDMIVALAEPAWGASTYNVMTGAATNPWCGQKVKIEYNGNSVEATIMDMCPGCSGHDLDLSLATWKALTGLDEKTRLKASWSPVS